MEDIDAFAFNKLLLRWEIERVLEDALQQIQVLCDEGYFAGQSFSPSFELGYIKNVRKAIIDTQESIRNNKEYTDMTIPQFCFGNWHSASLEEQCANRLQTSILKKNKIWSVRAIMRCSPEQFSLLTSEFEKHNMLLPLAFLAVYRVSR